MSQADSQQGTSMEFSVLKGKTLTKVDVSEDEMIFHTTEGERYKLYHAQDCCESVTIEDIVGDVDDLLGSPILVAEDVSNQHELMAMLLNNQDHESRDVSETWTYYKLDTAKGGITVRWYGSSNGYYSESVDFCKVDADGDAIW